MTYSPLNLSAHGILHVRLESVPKCTVEPNILSLRSHTNHGEAACQLRLAAVVAAAGGRDSAGGAAGQTERAAQQQKFASSAAYSNKPITNFQA